MTKCSLKRNVAIAVFVHTREVILRGLSFRTYASDSIARVSRVTSAIEGAFSVGTVGISVAVVGKIATMVHRQTLAMAFIDIWKKKH